MGRPASKLKSPDPVDMKHLDAAIEDCWQAIDTLMREIGEKHTSMCQLVASRSMPLHAQEAPTELWMRVNAQVCAIATLQAVKRDAAIESGTFGK
jgi:hypothetical protein